MTKKHSSFSKNGLQKGGGGAVLKLVYSSMNLHPYFGVTHCTLHHLQLQSHLKNSVDTLIHTSLLLKLIWTTEMSSCLQIIPSDWWLFWKPKSKCFQLSTLFFSRFTCEKSAYKRMGFNWGCRRGWDRLSTSKIFIVTTV